MLRVKRYSSSTLKAKIRCSQTLQYNYRIITPSVSDWKWKGWPFSSLLTTKTAKPEHLISDSCKDLYQDTTLGVELPSLIFSLFYQTRSYKGKKAWIWLRRRGTLRLIRVLTTWHLISGLTKGVCVCFTELVIIKLTKNAVPLRFRCGSCELKFCRYLSMFCNI